MEVASKEAGSVESLPAPKEPAEKFYKISHKELDRLCRAHHLRGEITAFGDFLEMKRLPIPNRAAIIKALKASCAELESLTKAKDGQDA